MSQNVGVDQAFIYHDANSLSQFTSGQDKQDALTIAAKQFEGIFLQMLMKSMRDSNNLIAEGGLFASHQQKFYQRMFDEQLAMNLSQQGQLGIAELIVEQLSNHLGNVQRQDTESYDQSPKGMSFEQQPTPTSPQTVPEARIAQAQLANTVNNQVVATAAITPPEVSEAQNTDNTLSSVSPARSTAEPENGTIQSSALDFSSPGAFIDSLLPHAKKAASLLGLSPLFMVAQAALETGWGKHVMTDAKGNSSNNFFGIKAGRSWSGDIAVKNTVEYDGNVATTERAKFRSYQSVGESFMDYAKFIQNNPRYENAVRNNDSALSYFSNLQTAGYATDPKYAEKIVNILNTEHFKMRESD